MAESAWSRLVESFLCGAAGERFFADGPPYWRQGRNGDPPTTSAQAKLRRRRDVKLLRRHGKQNPAALSLANRIDCCDPQFRCASGACAECMRAVQRVCVAAAVDLIATSSVAIAVVSVVSRRARIEEGALSEPSLLFGPLATDLRRALRASGIRRAFGGFDVSANEHSCDRFQPHYRPHAWVFMSAERFDRSRKVFKAAFPAGKTVRRPVVAKLFDGRTRAFAYALKFEFQRRVTLPRTTAPDGTVRRRNTRDRPLRALQKVELALALDSLGLGARLFLHGFRLIRSDRQLRLIADPPIRARSKDRR
jgi:hypothetical protein